MKNVQLWSRETDRQVLMAASIIACLILSACFGYLLPLPVAWADPQVRFVDALITFAMAIVTWMAFRVLEPARYGVNWLLIKRAGIPLVWMLMVLSLWAWICYSQTPFTNEFQFLTQAVESLGRPIL